MGRAAASVLLPAAMLFTAGTLGAEEAGNVMAVRGTNPRLTRLISGAERASATFRCVHDILGRTDGRVYVHEGQCGRGLFACLMMRMHIAGPYRLLTVTIDLRRRPDADTMASIGHELWHAVEVLREPNVRDEVGMFSLFEQIGLTRERGRYETREAIRIGDAVLHEVRAFAKLRAAAAAVDRAILHAPPERGGVRGIEATARRAATGGPYICAAESRAEP